MTTKKKPAALGGSFSEWMRGQLESPEFRRHYEERRVVLEVAMAIRRMREEAGLTQAELARIIGVKQPMIARVERGSDRRTPSWDTLRRVGLALGHQLVLEFVASKRDLPLVKVDGRRPATAA